MAGSLVDLAHIVKTGNRANGAQKNIKKMTPPQAPPPPLIQYGK